MAHHFVYLYRSTSGVPKYVGYGTDPARAMSHAGATHNHGLKAWLERGHFDLTIAGPYRDELEGKHVEAALISALSPEFNVSPGEGPRFLPVGVPPELSERPALAPLTTIELGKTTGGALLVYLAPGDYLSDGRRKYDPAAPTDEDVLSNIRGVWDIGKHLNQWAAEPDAGPQVLIGIHGKNLRHRFIVGAIKIDTSRWGDPALRVEDRKRWMIPLADPLSLDACELRGRRVVDVKFGQFSHQLHRWIDAAGNTVHPLPTEA